MQKHRFPDGSQVEGRGPSDFVVPGLGAAEPGQVRLPGPVAALPALTHQ